jgi:acetoacetyl-CoA synthetase
MTARPVHEGDLLWTPSPERVEASRLAAYMKWLAAERGLDFADYAALHAFSVAEPGPFWRTIWDYFEVRSSAPPRELVSGDMPNAHFFAGARVNYAEHALRRRDDHPALIFRAEDGERSVVTYAELAELVARVRAGLAALGVGPGDRVAAILPNRPEAVVAFLATASLGAIWTSCSPEFGSESVLDRFRQIEPKVLLAVESYRYGGKVFDRREHLEASARRCRAWRRSCAWARRGRVASPSSLGRARP